MKHYITNDEKLRTLVTELVKQQWNIISADPQGLRFGYINDGKDLVLDALAQPTGLSAKQFFFPKTEPLFFYRKNQDAVDLIDPVDFEKKTVLFGVKPCDAAGLPVLQKLFNWDYEDQFFNKRRDSTIVIGLGCDYSDSQCFCTSVGLHQDAEKGSDIFLKPAENGYYLAVGVTEKGQAFAAGFPAVFGQANENDVKLLEKKNPLTDKKFSADEVKLWLDNHFEDEFWNEAGEMCLGCAQCAFVCPVCHCFDIVDESCGLNCGRRVKNWDACQFGLFTKHASGHNPRDNQEKRYRQRVSHKFKYYQDKFEEILCTGCGRCSRGCPVGIDIAEIVGHINQLQKEAAV